MHLHKIHMFGIWSHYQLVLIIKCDVNRYTKMGFSGNLEPQYIIPTVLATKAEEGGLAGNSAKRDGIEDLDFHVGDAAFDNSTSYQLNYPIRHGLIDNWDNMERMWSRCIFEYLRVEPEDHYVLLTGAAAFMGRKREIQQNLTSNTIILDIVSTKLNLMQISVEVQALFYWYLKRTRNVTSTKTSSICLFVLSMI